MKHSSLILFSFLIPLVVASQLYAQDISPAVTSVEAARGVVGRIVPEHAHHFVLEEIAAENGSDIFEIESRDGKVVLRGSNGVAICSALNWYLKYYCNAHFSWNGTNLNLPETLPVVDEKVRQVSPYKHRYFFNYCCFGYSMAWWDWPQWERMIDWMALNGINMPLAVTGQEAVWQAVMRRLEFSEEDINSFLAGPPYLPFGWMGCLDGWGGPLPKSWVDSHLKLGQRILKRERALGMTPVLQGFTGHISPAIKDKYPDAELHKIRWCGWDTHFIDPLNPLFKQIGKVFIEEQTRLLGTDHLYAADTFIEMTPPSNDPAFLARMGETVHGSMVQADADAVWVMQGWIFLNRAKFWQPPQVEALFSRVPDDRMIILDLFCEKVQTWKTTKSFHGKTWIFCFLQNFGNNVQLCGPLERVNRELRTAIDSPNSSNLQGIGMTQEGLGYNPIVFDFMTEMAWHGPVDDVEAWVQRYAEFRYGGKNADARAAWDVLLRTAYSGRYLFKSTVMTSRPMIKEWPTLNTRYSPFELLEAWERLNRCAGELGNVDAYRYDLVHVARQSLSNLSEILYRQAVAAWQEKDRNKLAIVASQFLTLVGDLDELLATREEFLLGRWLEDAKRWGGSDEEKRVLEWNARNVVTLWGDKNSQLFDYARKEWSGLLKDFYLPRWALFFEQLDKALEEGKTFDGKAFTREVKLQEEAWTKGTQSYPDRVRGDSVALALKLYKKYQPFYKGLKIDNLANGKPVVASSVYEDQKPERAVDGIAFNRNSGWWADPYPQWLKIDLEEISDINGVHLYFFWDGKRYYQYTVEVSLDGENWKTVINQRENNTPTTSSGERHSFKPEKARYVRINILHNSANTGVHLSELVVLGAKQ
jgi:alpha-N-acetylglucosaminidase